VSLTLEGFLEGALQSVELRATYRDYDSRWVSDDGFVIDLLGHFAQNGVIGDGDAVILKPRLRWSGVESRPGVLLPAGFEPGRYFEVGAKAEYYYPFATWLLGGPNFALYQRWFSEPVVVGGSNRADTFYAPGAAIIIRDVVAQNVDIRFDYRFERQISNDPTRDFDNHYAGGRLLARF